MSIRIIASKDDPDAMRLYQRFRMYGRYPVATHRAILFTVDDATIDEKELILTLEMKK
jgi:hypothetical protein